MTTATRSRRTTKGRTKRQYTEEEKAQFQAQRAERKARTAALADATLSGLASTPEHWRSFLWTAAMHPARPGVVNVALIAAQAPGELADDFHGWRRNGRQVRRGETSRIRIFTAVRSRPKDNQDDDQDQGGRFAGFSTGTLFTLAQTDPREDAVENEPGPPHPRTAAQVARASATALAAHGIEAEADPDNARALLGTLARTRHLTTWNAAAAHTHAEGEAAAYVAAAMLGLPDPGPVPLPEMSLSGDDKDPYSDIKATAARVMTFGRELAAELAR